MHTQKNKTERTWCKLCDCKKYSPTNYKPINDGNSNHKIVYLHKSKHATRETPHCKNHGAMIKVSESGLWRCIQAVSLKTGKTPNDCRAGCEEQ